MVSKLSEEVYELLRKVFPHNMIVQEHYVNYGGRRLFFDFYIKELDVLIEVQGRQHDRFVKHFHGDKEGFLSSKGRDNLKKAYCQENDMVLLEIKSSDELYEDELLDRIWEGMMS